MPNNHSKYRIPGTIAGPLHPVLANGASHTWRSREVVPPGRHRRLSRSRQAATTTPTRNGESRIGGFRGVAPPGRNPGPRRSRHVATTTLTRNGQSRAGETGGSPPRVSTSGAAGGAAGRRPASSRDHGGARIDTPGALAGKTLDFHALAAEKLFDGAAGLIRPDTGQGHVPVGRLEWEGGQ
jgi:hypothetical protein